MLSGLISDTLKSPTTHPSDKVIAPWIGRIGWCELGRIRSAMLKAGTNWQANQQKNYRHRCWRLLNSNGNNVRVASGQYSWYCWSFGTPSWNRSSHPSRNVANGYSDLVLMITDIVNSNSEILALGANIDIEAANFKLKTNFMPSSRCRFT